VKIKGKSDDHPQPYLAEDLEPAGKSFFIPLEYLNIVVKVSDQTKPDGGNDQEHHIYVVYLGEKQCGQKYRGNDNYAPHGRRSFFFHLTIKAKVADFFPDLLSAQHTNKVFAEEDGNEQGEKSSHSRAE